MVTRSLPASVDGAANVSRDNAAVNLDVISVDLDLVSRDNATAKLDVTSLDFAS
jgi:hypothetical protein